VRESCKEVDEVEIHADLESLEVYAFLGFTEATTAGLWNHNITQPSDTSAKTKIIRQVHFGRQVRQEASGSVTKCQEASGSVRKCQETSGTTVSVRLRQKRNLST